MMYNVRPRVRPSLPRHRSALSHGRRTSAHQLPTCACLGGSGAELLSVASPPFEKLGLSSGGKMKR